MVLASTHDWACGRLLLTDWTMLTPRDDLPVDHFLTHVGAVHDSRARQVAAVLLGVETAARPGRFVTAAELAERWQPGAALADALDHLARTPL